MRFFDVFPFVGFLILVLMILGKSILLKNKNVPIFSNTSKTAFTKYILYPLFILTFILLIFELTKPVFKISFSILSKLLMKPLIESIYPDILGTILITISLILMGLTLQNFSKSLRFGMDSNNLGKLTTTGIFSFSRNPFFVSVELFFIGVALLLPNLFFMIIALLTIVSIHLFILKEEQFLKQNYGKEYESYAKKVGRYF